MDRHAHHRLLPPLALLALLVDCAPAPAAPVAATRTRPAPAPVDAVTPAPPHTLALGAGEGFERTADGAILAWGDLWRAPLPRPLVILDQFGPLRDVVDIVALPRGGCALLGDGHLRCWSEPSDDGKPHEAARFSLGEPKADALAGYGDTTCARRGGAVSCWKSPHDDIEVVAGVSGAVDLARGDGFTCAVLADGAVTCWGRSERGQTGEAPMPAPEPPEQRAERQSPPRIVAGLGRARRIAAGQAHACAVLEDGGVACWGAGGSGELTGEPGPDSGKPQRVPGIRGARSIALGEHHGCALVEGGKVACWGANYRGQAAPARRAFAGGATEIAGVEGATEIAAGPLHSCARRGDSSIACWGDDHLGELGVGARALRRPVVTVGQSLTAPATPADPACPGGRVHVDDWSAWETAMSAGPDEQTRAELLARVGIEPFPPDDDRDDHRACEHAPVSATVGASDVALADDGPPWKLVEARYVVCAPPPDPEEAGRVDGLMRMVAHQILRPLGGGDYCRVTGGPATTRGFARVTCRVGQTEMHVNDEEPGELAPIDLVSAKHKTLRFDQRTGSCLAFRLGELSAATSFFEVTKGPGAPALTKIFGAVTAEATRTLDRFGPSESVELTLGKGAFPRSITAVTETACPTGADPAPQACKPTKRRAVFVSKNGVYVDPSARPKKASPKKASPKTPAR